MCGRYTLRKPGLLKKYIYQSSFEEFDEKHIQPRFNVAPSQQVAVIRNDKQQHPAFGMIRWGLIPSWQKTLPKVQPINAKAETVETSGMFKNAFTRRRCLMPADGFYEWKDLGDGNGKTPFFIRRTDDEIFHFAGIWERWKQDDETILDTVCQITTTPNEVMAAIHSRMPVMLTDDEAKTWLNPETPVDDLRALLRPFGGDMQIDQVSKRVSSPKNEGPENIIPL